MIIVGLITIAIILGYAIYSYVSFELMTIRLQKRIERMKQRDADKQQAKRKAGRT